MAIAAVCWVTLAGPVLAAEAVTEHSESHSMQVETVPMAPPATVPAPTRVYEHTTSPSRTASNDNSTTPPAAIVRERTTNSVETQEKN